MDAIVAPSDGGGSIVLVGFMGAGKTSGVRSLAAQLDCQPLDSDHELERSLGESVESFFDREGEHAFRAREEEAVLELLGRPSTAVIALGGGALGSDRVREALARHLVVHIEVDPDDAWRRASGKGRPLARDAGRFRELYEQRRPLYDSVADAVLPPGDRGTPLRALAALQALRSVDIASKEPAQALRERTDSCTVPAAAVVAEAMVALVLGTAYRDKFGGDDIGDSVAAERAYRERIGWTR